MLRPTVIVILAAVVCNITMIVAHSHHHHTGISGKAEKLSIALDRVLEYILDNHKDIHLDGLFGVVFAQAHLDAILNMDLEHKNLVQIQRLKTKAEFIYNVVKPQLYNDDQKQIIFVEEILEPQLWQRKIDFRQGLIEPNPPQVSNSIKATLETFEGYLLYLSSSNMSESQSDECLLEMIQTGSRLYYHECQLTEDCRKFMVEDPNYDPTYGITHRLLYLQIGRGRKCAMHLDWYHTQTRSYCSYILWEATLNLHFGFLEELDDILLEQITLCGFEGFAEFLGNEFIDHVLDIQTVHGCFGIPTFNSTAPFDQSNTKNRKRRSASLITHGCNDHTTGLGASTLALMLRYLMSK